MYPTWFTLIWFWHFGMSTMWRFKVLPTSSILAWNCYTEWRRTKRTWLSSVAACTFPSACVKSPECFEISQRLDLRRRKPQVAVSVRWRLTQFITCPLPRVVCCAQGPSSSDRKCWLLRVLLHALISLQWMSFLGTPNLSHRLPRKVTW